MTTLIFKGKIITVREYPEEVENQFFARPILTLHVKVEDGIFSKQFFNKIYLEKWKDEKDLW